MLWSNLEGLREFVVYTGGQRMSDQAVRTVKLETAIEKALEELGVPGEGYPAPVTNAVEVLQKALDAK